MKNRSNATREEREWLLQRRAHPDSDWLGRLARKILADDPQGRSLTDWLRAQGTGPPHVQQLAFHIDEPEPAVPRVTRFQQTEKEYVFLQALLDLIAAGHDVRKLLGITLYKVGHRRRDPLASEIAEEIEFRVKEGDRVGKAIRDVAGITDRTEGAVRGIRQRRSRVHKR